MGQDVQIVRQEAVSTVRGGGGRRRREEEAMMVDTLFGRLRVVCIALQDCMSYM